MTHIKPAARLKGSTSPKNFDPDKTRSKKIATKLVQTSELPEGSALQMTSHKGLQLGDITG
jgi:hypothetical protein